MGLVDSTLGLVDSTLGLVDSKSTLGLVVRAVSSVGSTLGLVESILGLVSSALGLEMEIPRSRAFTYFSTRLTASLAQHGVIIIIAT